MCTVHCCFTSNWYMLQVRDTTGVTFPCLYKGVYPASPVYEPTRAPTLWIASMVLQCQGTAETIVIGHYPQQAVAAWMADEGMRLLHEVLSKECDGALLNFDPRTLEQVCLLPQPSSS